jgi:hypothetical protein
MAKLLLPISLASASKLKPTRGTGSLSGRGSALNPISVCVSHQAHVELRNVSVPRNSIQFRERLLVAARTFVSRSGVAGSCALNGLNAVS